MNTTDVIRKLFRDHFFKTETGWEWSYQEGVTLNEMDPELVKEAERILALGSDDKPV